ncbi:MAG: IS110 family transposase [Candidatus Aminicenantes bacterium]|nr:IS110 family transposase [Candidatus Aminicenantes bacterium]
MVNLFCGIDISKDSFHATLINENQKILSSLAFPMSSPGFLSFLQSLLHHCQNTQNLIIGMESSGSYYLNLFSFLTSHNLNCLLLNPLLISNFSKLSLRKTKTDRKDSLLIAEFLRVNAPNLPKPEASSVDLRPLARERERISQHIAALKNEIKRVLYLLFPELLGLINPFTSSSLRLLQNFPSRKAFSTTTPSQIRRFFSLPQRGRKNSASPEKLISAAKKSVGLDSPFYEQILKTKIIILITLQEELKKITTLLVEASKKKASGQMEILKSIKGINDITSSHFLAEIDNKEFSSPKKMIAFAGVDPSIHESGQFKGKSRISKRGNKSLRRVLYLMATSVIKVNPIFREYFQRKKAQGKRFKEAVMAVIHKLIRVIYTLLARQSHFILCPNSL